MRLELGELRINNGQSIIAARKKIYNLVLKLSGNSILAARTSSVLSQTFKTILNTAEQLSVLLSIDSEIGEYESLILTLKAQRLIDGTYLDNSVFDNVKSVKKQDELYYKEATLILRTTAGRTTDQIWKLRDIVNEKSRDELVEEIKSTNIELKESLDNLKKTTSAKERMESELNIGRDIQMSMLPLKFPAFPERDEIDILAMLHPAREVGGDFYDFFFIDEHRLCFCVGDVSGKGVPAALFMAMTKTLIKSRATDDLSTASIITHINDELSEENKSSMFVTVFICILDTKTGELKFTNAGHNPPFVIKTNGTMVKLDELHGPVVGAIYGMTYKENRLMLNSEDIVLLYTDGVTEAMNENGALYSEDRLLQLIKKLQLNSLDGLFNEIISDIRDFEGNAEQADDITLIAVCYNGTKESTMETRERLVVKNDLSEIENVNNKFSQLAKKHKIDEPVIQVFNIVFDEILNNIISYAYEDEEEHKIDIKVHISEGRINVSITDDGKPFNPLGLNPPDTSATLEERKIGGLGIHLVRKMMDDINYQRKIDKNVLSMTKVINSNNA